MTEPMTDAQFVDTHCHFDFPPFSGNESESLELAYAQGVRSIIVPTISAQRFQQVLELANRYPMLYAALGLHPLYIAQHHEQDIDVLVQALAQKPNKLVAIGEIGLDYHYEDIPRERQQAAFRAQMALARELNLPVIVHEREAHEDGIRIVEEFPEVTGVFHCYSGSAEMAKWLIARGWYIGFTGVLTFKNARKAVETAAAIPLNRIVLETDCPYMSPEPFRGKRNDPGKLYRMAERLAEIRGISVEEVRAATMENGKRLYRI